MKNILMTVLFLLPLFAISQNVKATMEGGRQVILKSDNTWEYAKMEHNKENSCVVENGFKEPKWNTSSTWKRMGTRVDDLKTHISVDMGVDEKDITLLSLSEQLGNGVYVLCVKGTKMKYRRTGSVFRKDGEDVLKMN
ncbi:DUF3157 family protein [Gelidibacter salicanalis]|uniref:DUF3157 family protein n=1 Tax=Gelidibacter salicanalis TaxID=291193 RepID=A0A934KNJ5_9FLAO|nr:DUF3157 family protein [Gelidibacter salicanalis]MBJ7880984.1 hypothetical protein [Gelidibacter salicanalis]